MDFFGKFVLWIPFEIYKLYKNDKNFNLCKKKKRHHTQFLMAHVSYLDVCILFKGLDHPKTDKLSLSIFFSTLTLQCGAWPVLRDLAVTFPRS